MFNIGMLHTCTKAGVLNHGTRSVKARDVEA